MKFLTKMIIINIIIALIISLIIGIVLNKTYTTRIDQRLDTTKEIINLKIETFINETNSIPESLFTILSYSNDKDFINDFLEDNHSRYPWIDHIYILNDRNQIEYDSKKNATLDDYNAFKFPFPISKNSTLNSKTFNIKESETLLLKNRIKVNGKTYTAAAEINMNAFENEVKLISSRYNIQVKGIDGTVIYDIGPKYKNSRSINYQYEDFPFKINISTQDYFMTRVIIPIIFIFLLIFLLLTFLAMIYKSRLDRFEHEKLIQHANNEKLRLIGTLAANTAHEIKNPLTSINGFIELTRMKYDKDKTDTHFNVISEELDRINNIVTQFLYLGKPTNLKYSNVNINQAVKEVIKFLEYEFEQNNITISLKMNNDSIYSFLSEDQLKQILINLFQNSKDALCETENAHINIKLSKNLNETATLIFNDNGPGIPSDIQKEIFDPFFTTKEFGSGLGLYLSKKLIEDWNGKIDVSTNPKQGTSFIITLPIAKNKKLE
ncbi:hypothetical protein GCM10010896_00070 [Mammaliicoccus stepanovicii]|uniref:two-component system sensor histidine kinase NtrB n=1 Tax=Mammaliicoccus stepanovicii TaxID=643214 RepID=UPI00166C3690|nr:ATP-binding protein [Mammaliicoccus stepanovicii]GGI38775.1 hypothetical protein GCM10010896_00070 [Mammaliicoccus stepanovicii]